MKHFSQIRVLAVLSLLILFISCNKSEDDPEIAVKSIVISGGNITTGGTSQMTAVISPANATNQEIEWSVLNPSIATIDQNGLLTAVSNGNVTVQATATDGSDVKGQKLIIVSGVSVPQVLVTGIGISGSNITNGASTQLTVQVMPANASNKNVTWSSSDVSVATVSATGLVSPLKNGSVTISAAAQDGSNVSGNFTLTISGVDVSVSGIVVETSAEILSAVANATAGTIINIKPGTYIFNSPISLNRNGQSGNLITLRAHPNYSDRPTFDFSSMAESGANRGINLSGSYWHVYGINIFNAGDNGMYISGSNNLIEFCTFSENSDSGLQIGGGGANNTILNCDSYFNADSTIENADGFAAKLDCGTGNKFIGCRAWNNLDDGWDGYLRPADNITTTYENCWAIRNGILKNGTVGGGDGNGFKTGGSDDKNLRHNAVYKNCLAVGNVVDGFDHNSNRGDITIYNSGSYANGRNYSFGTGNIAASLTIKNSVSLGGSSADQLNATVTNITNNGWQNGIVTSAADFVSLNIDLLLAPRQADGSLPAVTFMQLVNGSDLINGGVNVGLPYSGSAPDIGVFEKE
jgi:hypothetical protein